MNYILITPLSTFSKVRTKYTYLVNVPECSVESIEAEQTNESVLRCLARLHDIEQHGGLDRIIVLCSKETLQRNDLYNDCSMYEYYQQVAKECGLHAEFDLIKLDECSFPQIVKSICSKVHDGDTVYIDGAGGQRTTSNIIQIVAKILRYRGVRNPHTLYASFQTGKTLSIESTHDFARMIDLADAFHEFMTTGKADQLILCFRSCPHNELVEDLLKAMSEFSDKIRLGDVDTIDMTIQHLQSAIDAIRTSSAEDEEDGLESVILRQFIPLIEDKLIGSHRSADYPRLVKWCLDNMLIQQALTIYVEKMPSYLFAEGIIGVKGNMKKVRDEYNRTRGKNQHAATWEMDVVFTQLLQERTMVDECMDCLNKKTNSDNPAVRDAIGLIHFFSDIKNWDTPAYYFANKQKQNLKKWIEEKRYTSYQTFLNVAKNQRTSDLWSILLNKPKSELEGSKDPFFVKKLKAHQRIRNGEPLNPPFYTPLSNDRFSDILLGYIYVKALRNQTNHASSDENLDDMSKEIFSQCGYDFSSNDLRTIRDNVYKALSSIVDVVNSK